MILAAIDWSVVGIKAGQLVLSLSILVVLHELGHFLPAKWFKCRVEKFYLFFDPWFSVAKKKIGETVYGIGWLPLGGYVKISGMIDESMDKEQMKLPAQPWEFRSKPAWQRLIIMIGGVTVNLLLGFIIFAMVLFVWGEKTLPTKNLKFGVYADSLGKSLGMMDGDRVIGVDGNVIENYFDFSSEIILNEGKVLQIERNGQQLNIDLPEGTTRNLVQRKGELFFYPFYPTVVDSIAKDAKFVSGQLLVGDQIIGIGGKLVPSFAEFSQTKLQFKDKNVELKVIRNSTDTIAIVVHTTPEGGIGFFSKKASSFLDLPTKKYGFFESLPAGVHQGWKKLVMNVKNFKLIFTSKEVKASESLGSFISIGNMFDSNWDWERFWNMTALLSIVLAFMNILPIPALDGGHVIFTIYEMISGKKPSEKFMEYAQMVGMVLLLSLMAYAIGLDFWRVFFK